VTKKDIVDRLLEDGQISTNEARILLENDRETFSFLCDINLKSNDFYWYSTIS
jgi:hypothetical protein